MQGDDVFARFLLDVGLLSRAQMDALLAREESLAQLLIREQVMSEEAVVRALSKCFGIPTVVLDVQTIDPHILPLIPEAVARANEVVAYRSRGGVVDVALLRPESAAAVRLLGLPAEYRVHLTDRQSMKRALLTYQEYLAKRYALEAATSDSAEATVDALLLHALSQQALTLHLRESGEGLQVRYRIAGALHDALTLPKRVARAVLERLRSLAQVRGAGMGRFTMTQPGAREPERVVVVVHAPASDTIVVHLARERDGRAGYSLEALGLWGSGLEQVYRAVHAPSGLVVVSGPPHSGRTTFLYTLLDLAVHPRRQVVSVESSIALEIPGVTQLGPLSDGVSYASRVRAALKLDPDVLMLSDVADRETMQLAVAAANRGLLVLVGMEAASHEEALSTWMQAVQPEELACVFELSVSLRLVPRLCQRHRPARLPGEVMDDLEGLGVRFTYIRESLAAQGIVAAGTQWKDIPFYAPEPCAECDAGYRGWVGLHEVLPKSRALARALASLDDAFLAERIAHEREYSLTEDGVIKAAQGLTTAADVLEAVMV